MSHASPIRMQDVDAIRPPSPRLTRAAVIALVLVAGGSFTSGFLRQVVGPLTDRPPADEAPAGPQLAQPLPIAPIVQPALQVATAEPAPARAPPKLDVPDPAPAVPVAEAAAPPQDAAAPPPVDAATTAPAEPPAEPAPPPEEPPLA